MAGITPRAAPSLDPVPQPAAPVYNLTVADYGTYFVGEGQALAHDNTPRLPTRALLPGFAPEGR